MFEVTKEIKWHMGHRLPNHNSKCKGLHGHTYYCKVFLRGELIEKDKDSSEGMVMDFSDIKEILKKDVYDVLDHGFMMYHKDPMIGALMEDENTNLIEVCFIPTAENIAKFIYETIKNKINNLVNGAQLIKVEVKETPTSTATYSENGEG